MLDEPRALHLGRHAQGVLRADHRAPSTRPSPGSSRRLPARPAFGGAAVTPLARRRARAPSPRELMPAIRGLIRQDRSKLGHFDDIAAVLEFVSSQEPAAAGGARHLLPRPLPAHQDPAAGRRLRSGQARYRRGRSPACAGCDRGLSRRTTPPTTSAASRPTRPPMRDANAVVYPRPRRRHAAPSPRTRRPRASPVSSTSTPST